MSEDKLNDLVVTILADPQFIVRVNNAAIAARRRGVAPLSKLPPGVQETIANTIFSPEFIREHFANAVRTVQARRTVVSPPQAGTPMRIASTHR